MNIALILAAGAVSLAEDEIPGAVEVPEVKSALPGAGGPPKTFPKL